MDTKRTIGVGIASLVGAGILGGFTTYALTSHDQSAPTRIVRDVAATDSPTASPSASPSPSASASPSASPSPTSDPTSTTPAPVQTTEPAPAPSTSTEVWPSPRSFPLPSIQPRG